MARQHDPSLGHELLDPDEDETIQRELHVARAQGDAYGEAVSYLTAVAVHAGDQQRAGDYWIGYAVQPAEGVYEWVDDQLVWREPGDGDLHLEITVRDAGDGRFVPCARVLVTVIGPEEAELGPHVQPLLWHPTIYHYGRDWRATTDGPHRLRVRVEPPTFMRQDRLNGQRFTEPVEVEFSGVDLHRAQDGSADSRKRDS